MLASVDARCSNELAFIQKIAQNGQPVCLIANGWCAKADDILHVLLSILPNLYTVTAISLHTEIVTIVSTASARLVVFFCSDFMAQLLCDAFAQMKNPNPSTILTEFIDAFELFLATSNQNIQELN